MKPVHKKVLSRLLIVFFSLLALFFIVRNPLLHWGIKKTSQVLKQRTGAVLTIGESSFKGISTVTMKDLILLPSAGDTLIRADSVNITISLWPLLVGTVRINEIFSSRVFCTISCRDNVCNYSGFISAKSTAGNIRPGKGTNYAVMFRRVLDKAFNLAPQRANIHDVYLTYRNDTLERSIYMSEFHSDENSLKGFAEDVKKKTTWEWEGKFSQVRHSLQLNVFPLSGGTAAIPLLAELTGLTLGFDTIHLSLNGYKWTHGNLKALGDFRINNLRAYHKKISEDTVRVKSASFEIAFNAGSTFMEIDSSSKASLTNIVINPYLRYSKDNADQKEFSLRIITGTTNANDFFSSLPAGMFDEVRDIKASGTLQYSLNFKINTSEPDSLIFQSSMKKEKFRIRNYGTSDLMKMNDEFVHFVFERDRLVRSFFVGPANVYYTPLANISPYFVNAVMTSEDGNFYFHNGFNEDAFRKSIITNFKAGKFVRGGSTISMQLVKNVFLNRKKTVARKAEEALLVWLIESNRLYSKDRMLEVYMNIIELGPDVYGIGEASDFYFKKRPSDLNLPESIFLASLLPHPKWFKYSFDTLGNLKPYISDYYRIVSDFMLKKSLITQEEHDNLQPHVTLVGPAREMVLPSDTIPEEENDDIIR